MHGIVLYKSGYTTSTLEHEIKWMSIGEGGYRKEGEDILMYKSGYPSQERVNRTFFHFKVAWLLGGG